ncbi:unnamed protein product [Victoria cruziana]
MPRNQSVFSSDQSAVIGRRWRLHPWSMGGRVSTEEEVVKCIFFNRRILLPPVHLTSPHRRVSQDKGSQRSTMRISVILCLIV